MARTKKEFEYYEVDKRPEEEGGHWLWTGRIDPDGYGRIRFMKRSYMAHRWVWMCVIGYIEDGMQLDHLCKVRNCVNPAHLEKVTGKVNTRRATNHNRAKTHCPSGHLYSPTNTYLYKGRRKCKRCNRERATMYRKKAASGATASDV